MKYMLLIYQGTAPTPRAPDSWARLSDKERKAIFGAYQGINQTPGVTPRVVLQAAEQTAITVRVENDKPQTIEGPFVPVEQALDGYLMFETDDADAAIELATRNSSRSPGWRGRDSPSGGALDGQTGPSKDRGCGCDGKSRPPRRRCARSSRPRRGPDSAFECRGRDHRQRPRRRARRRRVRG
jgi:hypothetical protein